MTLTALLVPCCTNFHMKPRIESNVNSQLTLLSMKREDCFSTSLYRTSINSAATRKSITNRLQLCPTERRPTLERKGCVLNVSNDCAMPNQFANLSGIERITTRLHQVLNQCALVAKDEGYEYFTIHNYGECYGAGENYTYTRRGKRSDCFRFGSRGHYGVGKEHSCFVYKIKA